MAIGAVSNETTPYIQKSNSGGDDIAKLQSQKEMLQKQLETVKSKTKNSQAEQDAAVKQIKQIKQQISEIDQKIQKLSQTRKQGQNASETTAVNSKKTALAQSNSMLAGVQNKQRVLHNMQQDATQEKALDKSKATDKLLDTYA